MTAKKTKVIEWNSFTKAELVKTVKRLDGRQTSLLNKITSQTTRIEALQHEIAHLRTSFGVTKQDPDFVLQNTGTSAPYTVVHIVQGAELDDVHEAQAAETYGVVHVRQEDLCTDEGCPQHGTPHVCVTPGVTPAKMPWEE